jgi:hypothetical protein
LPLSDFEFWVEHSAKPIAGTRMIHVDNATDLHLPLNVEFENVQTDRPDWVARRSRVSSSRCLVVSPAQHRLAP